MKLKILTSVCVIAIICVIGLFIEIVRENSTFTVTHYDLNTSKLEKDMKIVVLSDLHNCSYGENNRKILQTIAQEQPDLILVAGDILVGKEKVPTTVAESFMNDVIKIAPVYYANGNHEQRMKEQPEKYGAIYEEYKRKITEAGSIFLENEMATISWGEEQVNIRGLEIPLRCYKKIAKETLTSQEITDKIGSADLEKFEILIAHNPVYAEEYANWGADLILSGHLHGGIVRIPFWRGVISPQIKLFPKYSGGRYKVKDSDLIVSRGLGTHTIKIRLFNVPEVVVLHIKGTK